MNFDIVTRKDMVVYLDPTCLVSRYIALIIAEKGINPQINWVTQQDINDELRGTIQNQKLPVVFDKSLLLYSPNIIVDYLDHMYPAPKLIKEVTAERVATIKKYLLHMYQDIMHPLNVWKDRITQGESLDEQAEMDIKNELLPIIKILNRTEFLFSNEISIIDCMLLPVLETAAEILTLTHAENKRISEYIGRYHQREPAKLLKMWSKVA